MSFRDDLRVQADSIQELEQRSLQQCNEWATGTFETAKRDLEAAVSAGNFSIERKGFRKIRTVSVRVYVGCPGIPVALRKKYPKWHISSSSPAFQILENFAINREFNVA